jgi:hypothetical protein
MNRSMVGLLAAVGTIMAGLVSLAHGDLVWIALADAGAATGLATFGAMSVQKNLLKTVF